MYALRRINGDVLYFDAVTNIEESYTSTVSKHPVATGGLISDHTIRDNKKFTLSAVLSDADYNLDRPALSGSNSSSMTEVDEDGFTITGNREYYEPGIYEYNPKDFTISNNKQFQNNTPTTTTVTINTGATDTFKKYLPETISQFTADTIPTVTVTTQNKVKTAKAVRDDLIYMWETSEVFTLMEYEDSTVTRFWGDCVFTRLSFGQDADTGLGLFPQMAIEKVTYTDIESVPITIRKVNSKGRKTGEVTKQAGGDDANKGPTKLSEQTSLHRLVSNANENTEAGN